MQYRIDMQILDQRIGNEFPLPKYSTPGSSGLDLCACIQSPLNTLPGETYLISTGLAIYIKNTNITAILVPRSGISHKRGITLGNGIGIIDSDYQGPIMLSIWNKSKKIVTIFPGERIAQLVFIPIIQMQLNIVTLFKHTSHRSNNGFGSSGKY